MRLGSLCTGYGGLDIAAHATLPITDTVFVADNDPHVASWLTQRMPDTPNLGDFTALDTLPDCDVLTAGFPCQPVSGAGKRAGTLDERWLWDDIERLLSAMDRPPPRLLLENVRGLLSASGGDAMGRVIRGLARVGYVGSYRVVSASDVGACHRRARVFIAAWHTKNSGQHGRPEPSDLVLRRPEGAPGRSDSATVRRGDTFGPYADAVHRWERILGRPAPNPTEPATNGRRLNPVFVEWMMGLPHGWVTDPTLNLPRTQQLRMLGNGVVPQQAEHAHRTLLEGR